MKNRSSTQQKTDKKQPLPTQPPTDETPDDADDIDEIPTETLAEIGDFIAWVSEEPDDEIVYHLELGQVTLHFFKEEWDDLCKLIDQAQKNDSD